VARIDGIYIEQDREPWQTIARVECNTNAQWKANAKLIARAPDLLAEVEQLKERCERKSRTLHAVRAQRDALVEAAEQTKFWLEAEAAESPYCTAPDEMLRILDSAIAAAKDNT
jgi:hypothetical protein